jgi:protease-4
MKIHSIYLTLLLSLALPLMGKVYLERPSKQEVINLSQPCIGCIEFNERIDSVSGDQFKKQLYKLLTNPLIRGILLIINSGGGAVTTSFELFEHIKQALTIKPVVTYIDSVCASGAYLMACPTHITTSPMAMIGSIGVFQEFQQMEPEEFKQDGLKGKVKRHLFTRGKFKSIGGQGLTPLTPEEEAVINKEMDFLYQQFCVAVAGQRNLSIEQVQAQEALTFPGVIALEHGLVNQVGTLPDAIEVLKKEVIKRGLSISDDIDLMQSMIKAEQI